MRSICLADYDPQPYRIDAIVRALDEIQIPARREGVIAKLNVRRGAEVPRDSLVAQIDTADAQASFEVSKAKAEVASSRAKDYSRIDAADADYQVALANQATINRIRRQCGAD